MRRASLLLLLFTATFSYSQQRPAITGIAFVRMYASNMPASEDFYGKTLGYDHATRDGILTYSVNDAQSLEVVPLPTPAPEARVAAIGFTTRNARELEKYLKAHSIKIDQPLRHGSFAVRDPEGHLVYFVQQGPASSKTISPHAASHRIIHTGFMVHDRAAEDAFWRGILGFRPYWYGGRTDNELNYVSSQVPDGTDWIEYMLHSSDAPPPNPHQLGSDFHFSLGIDHMPDVVAALARNHCEGPNCSKTQMGRDGKVQLNLFDPDLTRVEYMEFQPSGTTCCSAFTGKHPTETEDH
jgi:catechol 2,3-dioxygenase-like lactoylglutathione lyase family enzyme